jgi:putative tricarboxylic transport membrane protein
VISDAAITPRRRLQAALPYVVVLAVGVFLYHEADSFEFEQVSGRIGPGAWPKIILALMLASALWGAISSAFRVGASAPAEESEAIEDEALVHPPELYPHLVWLAVGATLAYLFLLPVLGFFLATIIFSFVLMYLGQYRKPLQVTALSIAIAFAFMFMFMRVVYVSLPLGIAPFDEVSYALMATMGVH